MFQLQPNTIARYKSNVSTDVDHDEERRDDPINPPVLLPDLLDLKREKYEGMLGISDRDSLPYWNV